MTLKLSPHSDNDFEHLRAAVFVMSRERFNAWTPQGEPEDDWPQFWGCGSGSAGI
jgi:hypothetical protein